MPLDLAAGYGPNNAFGRPDLGRDRHPVRGRRHHHRNRDRGWLSAAGSLTVGSGQANAALFQHLGNREDVSAVTVTLYEAGGTMFVASETTAADGTYMFGTVGSGDYDLEFLATGYVTEWFPLRR